MTLIYKKLIGVLLVFNISTEALSQELEAFPGSEIIIWSEKKLTWLEFKEEVNFDKYPYKLAITRWRLVFREVPGINESDTVRFKIAAVMFPLRSWVRKKSRLVTDALLAHEQLHFDIVELGARMLRKQLSEKEFSKKSYKKEIDKLKRKIMNSVNAMQENYDTETKGHNDIAQQEQWQSMVNKELLKLKDYVSQDMVVVLK